MGSGKSSGKGLWLLFCEVIINDWLDLQLQTVMNKFRKIGLVGLAIIGISTAIYYLRKGDQVSGSGPMKLDSLKIADLFPPPDTSQIQREPNAELIRYGRELITNTRKYLGSDGTVMHISNRLNCQSCHLESGAKATAYSANFMGVAANYPLYRERSGMTENIQYRVNDCMMRSMNGKPLDTEGLEMRAMVAYILWVGKNVPAKTKPVNSKIEKLPFMHRAADTLRGERIYAAKCIMCHGTNGNGGYSVDSATYYPPLWGDGSFNTAAGMYRISTLAGFIKNNMPFGVSYGKSQLSDEECWDVAAFINSRPRPYKNFPSDWPDISKKAIDHPFGPYADSFSEHQHKFGPYGPILNYRKKQFK